MVRKIEIKDEDGASTEEVAQALGAFMEVLRKMKEEYSGNHSQLSKSQKAHSDSINNLIKQVAGVQAGLEKLNSSKDLENLKTELSQQLEKLEGALGSIESYDDTSVSQRIDEVESKIPTLPDEETPIETRNKLETLKGDERLDKSAIRGLDELEKKVKEQNPRGVSIFGTSKGIYLYVNGLKKGLVSTLNLIPGTGVTMTYNRASGRNDITISASSGGSGFTILTATGTVNSVNKTFTFTSQPSFIVSDGAWYPATSKDGVTVNWTYLTGTVTMTIPPATDIYGIQ